MIKHHLFYLITFFLGSVSIQAQPYLAGETYFGENDFIEYKAGNLPIVITAPHGGSLEPSSIPDRNCPGCVYVKDSFTEELIRQMYDAIFEEFGCYPHIIINRLHRRKLDANRAIGDAADGNVLGEQAWADFHDFVEAAKGIIETEFGKGLYLDLHGHGHEIQRLELGYRITKSELQLSNTELNGDIYVNDASIKNLVSNNLNTLNLSELLRGADSFGELYEMENYPAVPSQADPFPLDDESYFSGGYNTERHGSKLDGNIDGIQIECNMEGVRDSHDNREDFAAATARALKNYLEKHYFGSDFLSGNCGLTFTNAIFNENSSVSLFPNPVNDLLTVKWTAINSEKVNISISNELGQVVFQNKAIAKNDILINCTEFPKGLYFLKIESETFVETYKFSK